MHSLFNGIISYFILALCLVNFGIIISVIARLAALLLALISAIASSLLSPTCDNGGLAPSTKHGRVSLSAHTLVLKPW